VEKSYAGRETFVKRYYPNGAVHSEVRLNGNVVDGASKYYRENGVLWQDLNLRGGMLEGREQYFRPDSSLQFDMIARSGAIVSGSCVAKNGSRRQLTQSEMKNWSLEQPVCD
jgi:antitoxin component YwqK of YwqJK toxin-antitoxin module